MEIQKKKKTIARFPFSLLTSKRKESGPRVSQEDFQWLDTVEAAVLFPHWILSKQKGIKDGKMKEYMRGAFPQKQMDWLLGMVFLSFWF